MMTYTEILHEQVEQIPPSYQAEASRYLEFLLQKIREDEQENRQDKILARREDE